jgi:hypothetical protein
MKLACAVLVVILGFVPAAIAAPWDDARKNAEQTQQGVRFCKRLVHGWLDQADVKTGLIPRNLTQSWFWNARDSAADNFPFFLLTAHATDDHHLKAATLAMLATEQKLTNRVDRLPDDYLFEIQGFRPELNMDELIFGASEYAKDGLTPITEWLGPGPWLDRMTGLMEDVWKHAPVDSRFGKLPSTSIEVNGEMMQVCSRLYWLTGDERYREWTLRLADYYFLDQDILAADRLQLDDHDCEVIGGLSEAYVVAAKTDAKRWAQYKPKMHAILDRVLKYGRQEDGLLYHTVNPNTGEILNKDLTDNWGYNYNAFLTVDLIDGVPRYREAVEHVLSNIHKHLDFLWENGGADGYADSIEGGINLLNRVPVESGWQWVDDSMKILLAKQQPTGIIEGWHGDGNSARTTLMWILWKTQGVTAAPWRQDVELGAVPEGKGIRIYLASEYPWRGKLRFDRPRHKDYFHMPFDYARLNQFPEWFTVEAGKQYRVTREGAAPITLSGKDLYALELELEAKTPLRITVTPVAE